MDKRTTESSNGMIDDPHIDLTDHPSQEARNVIVADLIDFNRRLLGDAQGKPLALLNSDDGAVVGGMWARTGFQWLFVELLFVLRSMRGRGLGRQLLDRAEQEAKRRGCIGAWLETLSPQVRTLDERCGYLPAGQRAGLPQQAMGSMIGHITSL